MQDDPPPLPGSDRPAGSVPPPPLPSPADEALLANVLARGENAGTKSATPALIVTVLLFLAAGGLSWGWDGIVLLLVAVAIHELGHVLAMRLFGYKNVRVLFIPLFGALASGEPQELDARRNAIVALAGPIAGLLSVVACLGLAFVIGPASWLVEFAWISLFLNALNLLPFVPLDGGAVANELLFSRAPLLELVFRIVAIIGLALVAYFLESWVLWIVPAMTLIATPFAFRRARILREERAKPEWQSRSLELTTIALLRGVVARMFGSMKPEVYEKQLPEHVHGTWLELRKRFPTAGQSTALMGLYVALLVIGLPVLTFVISTTLGAPPQPSEGP